MEPSSGLGKGKHFGSHSDCAISICGSSEITMLHGIELLSHKVTAEGSFHN